MSSGAFVLSTLSSLALLVYLIRPWWALPRSLLRLSFWIAGVLLALFQSWIFRYHVSADSISYLDMSDGVLRGNNWHRLINSVWSPLYPFLLGTFRRIFGIEPGHEIVAAHLLNVAFFIFAFICFELFTARFIARAKPAYETCLSLPRFVPWARMTLVYSLFLWASLSVITVANLRPDMLMSGFLYLAAAKLGSLRRRHAAWSDYLGLGIVLGIGFLAKAPMLPIAVLILVLSIVLVRKPFSSIAMAVASLAIVLTIGSMYFVPLSISWGHFTLGESGAYNYLVHVDRAGPSLGWYLRDPGKGAGRFSHPPTEISHNPPIYTFPEQALVTHPLRFDPAVRMRGVEPRFSLSRQISESYLNLVKFSQPLRELLPSFMVALLLIFSTPTKKLRARFIRAWPLALLGLAGCAMYVMVHLEARYTGPFLVLFCSSIMGLYFETKGVFNRTLLASTILLASALLLLRPVLTTYSNYLHEGKGPNYAASAAVEMNHLGIRAGDRVARISAAVSDLAMERIARVEVTTEVDFSYAKQFWLYPPKDQERVLRLLTSQPGVKAVLATDPLLNNASRSGWKQLAESEYWIWLPNRTQM